MQIDDIPREDLVSMLRDAVLHVRIEPEGVLESQHA